MCHAAAVSNMTVADSCQVRCVSPTIFRKLSLFYSSGPEGENDRNLGAPNLVDPNVEDPDILDDNLLRFIATVQSELSKFRTATSGTSKCSVQDRRRPVKVNTVVVSRQQYHCAH